MNEEAIYQEFTGEWLEQAKDYFVGKNSAVDFLDYLERKNIRILGIDGFELGPEFTVPNMEWISDYSSEQPTKEVMRSFIKNGIEHVTHFNFVLDV